jgi:hypothetical protein
MTMSKNVGLTYVKDFTFPAEQGFTGSAGVHQVKGYQRGGQVKMAAGGKFGKPRDKYPALKSGPVGKQGSKMPKNVKMKGGEVHAQMGGSVGLGRMGGNLGQDREISVDDVRISVPKKHGGKMSVHDKLYHEGGKMGYAYGGQVKPSNTSSEFKMTKGRQKTMDTGNQPARRGRNQAEIEAGGTKRLKPGLKKGGYMHGGVHRTRMPKNVKSHGGLARYAAGGVVEAKHGGFLAKLARYKKSGKLPKGWKQKSMTIGPNQSLRGLGLSKGVRRGIRKARASMPNQSNYAEGGVVKKGAAAQ